MDEKIKDFKGCSGMLVHADKTGNIYNVDRKKYEKPITNELSKDYKICDPSKNTEINHNICLT